MHKYIFLIILLVSTYTSQGQFESSYILLLEQEVKRLQPSGTILYGNMVPLEVVDLKLDLRWNKYLKNRLLNCINKGTMISKHDIREIRHQMKKVFVQHIPDSLFANSKSLSIDSLHKSVNLVNLHILDSIASLSREKRPKERLVTWEFYFSRPVFNKTKTLMLFFFMYYYSSGGEWTYFITTPGNTDWSKMCRFGCGAW